MAIAPFKFGPSGTTSSILGKFKQLYSVVVIFKQLHSNLGKCKYFIEILI